MLQLMITIDRFSLYVLFCHLRPLYGTKSENCLFQFRPMRVHPRADACTIYERTKGKFPGEYHMV